MVKFDHSKKHDSASGGITNNISSSLIWALKQLKNKSSSDELDAEVLLAFVLKKNRSWLFSYPEKKLSAFQREKFKYLILKRARRVPVAYLTGEKEFFGYSFKVNSHTLAPRPLTEEIIDKALEWIAKNKKRPITIADIGTGSGCIIIALAKKLSEHETLNNFRFYGSDISAFALRVAKKNAILHQVEKHIKFLRGHLLIPLDCKNIDLVLANLPYLNSADIQKEPSIQKEPPIALIGDFYTELFKQIDKLKPRPTVIFEDKKGVHTC